jgi:hypothetical protein
MGPDQVLLNDAAVEEYGRPLPWWRYPQPYDQLSVQRQGAILALVEEYPTVNQLRRVSGQVYWYLRITPGLMDVLDPSEALPGDPVDDWAPTGPTFRQLRRQLLEELQGAFDSGRLADPATKAAAAAIGFALREQRAIGPALRDRIPVDRLPAEIARVAAVVPACAVLDLVVR